MRETSGRRTRQAWVAAITLVVAAAGALAIWRGTQSATLPDASCGAVDTHILGGATRIFSGSDAGALGCFSAAARGCKAASIRVTETGTDTGTSYVFVIGSGGPPCPVTELSQGYGWTGGNLSTGPIISISCRLTSVTGSGVMLGCRRLDVLIPAAVAASGAGGGLPPPSCGGQVFASHVDSSTAALSGTDPGVLACFSRAARECRSASIEVTVSPGYGAGTGYVFRIESGTAACHVTELRQAWGMNGAGWWSGVVTSMSCRLTTVTGRGVRLRCAGLDVLVPAAG